MIEQVRQAMRGLGRTPAASVTSIVVLTLGIGASTAVFGIINGALLRPLSGVRQPAELGAWFEAAGAPIPELRFSVSAVDE